MTLRLAAGHGLPLRLSLCVSLIALAAGASQAQAMTRAEQARLARVEAAVAAQQAQIDNQERRLANQAQQLEVQQAELTGLRQERAQLRARMDQYMLPASATASSALDRAVASNAALADMRAGQSAERNDTAPQPRYQQLAQVRPATDGTPNQPVGEAPPPEREVRAVTALPEQVGVLTPKGHLIFDPSIEYVRSSSNRLVFRGVEIVPGIQLGVIEANDADRDSLVGTAALRYGLTRRLEVEARVPYVYRHDRVTTVAQRDDTISRTMNLDGQDIGDVELSARYQLNEVRLGRPIYVANLRIKPATGRGPYDVNYDSAGVATDLATGSGFWATEAGVSMLYPTDPAVIFASFTYLHNWGRNIDKTIGTAAIGRVEPGDSIGAAVGFGLSLNPRFSISMGYSHNYIFQTRTEIGGVIQKSNSLQVGSMLMGWSFRINDRVTLNNNFQFGVTSDAPNMQAVFSLPVKF